MPEFYLYIVLIIIAGLALLLAVYPLRLQKLSCAIVVLIILSVLGMMYWQWGALSSWRHYTLQTARQSQVRAMLKTMKGPQEVIARLKGHLNDNPSSARGWYLLGRLYMSQKAWQQALEAFQRAYFLKPHDEMITINYAQCLMVQPNNKHRKEARKLLLGVLAKNKSQPDALAILAMDAYTHQSFQQAIYYWRQLLLLLPENSEEANAIQKAIAMTEKKI